MAAHYDVVVDGSWRKCDGPLPRALPSPPGLVVTLIGCTSKLQLTSLLLAVDATGRSVCTIFPPFHLRCENPNFGRRLAVSVDGQACGRLRRLTHVSHADCAVVVPSNHSHIDVQVVSNATPLAVSVPLSAAEQPVRGCATCAATAIFGDERHRSHQLRLFTAARRAWASLDFTSAWVFAQSAQTCAEFKRAVPADAVACILRRRWTLSPSVRSHSWQRTPYFDQGVHAALCLLYARAARVEFLALTDHDEAPPLALWEVLRPLRLQQATGVKLFFDADRSCPQSGGAHGARDGAHDGAAATSPCPCTEDEFRRRCHRRGRHRNHWKPIVMPARTHDISVHSAVCAAGYTRALEVWCPCLQHIVPPRGLRRYVIPIGV